MLIDLNVTFPEHLYILQLILLVNQSCFIQTSYFFPLPLFSIFCFENLKQLNYFVTKQNIDT